MSHARVVAAVLTLTAGLAVSGCAGATSPASESGTAPLITRECGEAFRVADEAERELYATHPFYGDEYDDVYTLSERTAEQEAWLDWALEDQEVQFQALTEPLYDACTGVEDLYAGAYALGEESYWGLVGGDEDLYKNIFVVSFCLGNETRPACADFVADDWR
jgi:hypothetical protein